MALNGTLKTASSIPRLSRQPTESMTQVNLDPYLQHVNALVQDVDELIRYSDSTSEPAYSVGLEWIKPEIDVTFRTEYNGKIEEDPIGQPLKTISLDVVKSAMKQLSKLTLTQIHHYAILGAYISDLYREKQLIDAIIIVNNQIFTSARHVLCCHSDFFAKLFLNYIVPPYSVAEVTLTNIDVKMFRQFLHFAHYGDIQVTDDNVGPLIRLSEILGSQTLRNRAIVFVKLKIELPWQDAVEDLKNNPTPFRRTAAIQSLVKNFRSLLDNPHYFKHINFIDMKEIVSSNTLNILSELDVFWGVLFWTVCDQIMRTEDVDKLMTFVRFTCMTTLELLDCARASSMMKISTACKQLLINAHWVCHAKELGLDDPLLQQTQSPRFHLVDTTPHVSTVQEFDARYIAYKGLHNKINEEEALAKMSKSPDEAEEAGRSTTASEDETPTPPEEVVFYKRFADLLYSDRDKDTKKEALAVKETKKGKKEKKKKDKMREEPIISATPTDELKKTTSTELSPVAISEQEIGIPGQFDDLLTSGSAVSLAVVQQDSKLKNPSEQQLKGSSRPISDSNLSLISEESKEQLKVKGISSLPVYNISSGHLPIVNLNSASEMQVDSKVYPGNTESTESIYRSFSEGSNIIIKDQSQSGMLLNARNTVSTGPSIVSINRVKSTDSRIKDGGHAVVFNVPQEVSINGGKSTDSLTRDEGHAVEYNVTSKSSIAKGKSTESLFESPIASIVTSMGSILRGKSKESISKDGEHPIAFNVPSKVSIDRGKSTEPLIKDGEHAVTSNVPSEVSIDEGKSTESLIKDGEHTNTSIVPSEISISKGKSTESLILDGGTPIASNVPSEVSINRGKSTESLTTGGGRPIESNVESNVSISREESTDLLNTLNSDIKEPRDINESNDRVRESLIDRSTPEQRQDLQPILKPSTPLSSTAMAANKIKSKGKSTLLK